MRLEPVGECCRYINAYLYGGGIDRSANTKGLPAMHARCADGNLKEGIKTRLRICVSTDRKAICSRYYN
ncbi:hypothetical protein ACWHA1_03285, partial [Streptomyces decoyicus]